MNLAVSVSVQRGQDSPRRARGKRALSMDGRGPQGGQPGCGVEAWGRCGLLGPVRDPLPRTCPLLLISGGNPARRDPTPRRRRGVGRAVGLVSLTTKLPARAETQQRRGFAGGSAVWQDGATMGPSWGHKLAGIRHVGRAQDQSSAACGFARGLVGAGGMGAVECQCRDGRGAAAAPGRKAVVGSCGFRGRGFAALSTKVQGWAVRATSGRCQCALPVRQWPEVEEMPRVAGVGGAWKLGSLAGWLGRLPVLMCSEA